MERAEEAVEVQCGPCSQREHHRGQHCGSAQEHVSRLAPAARKHQEGKACQCGSGTAPQHWDGGVDERVAVVQVGKLVFAQREPAADAAQRLRGCHRILACHRLLQQVDGGVGPQRPLGRIAVCGMLGCEHRCQGDALPGGFASPLRAPVIGYRVVARLACECLQVLIQVGA